MAQPSDVPTPGCASRPGAAFVPSRVLWRGASAPWPHGSHCAWPVHRPGDAPVWSTARSTGALTIPLARGTATPPAPCREPRFPGLPVGIGCSGSSVTCVSLGEQPLLCPLCHPGGLRFALGSISPCPLAVKLVAAAWGHKDISEGKTGLPPLSPHLRCFFPPLGCPGPSPSPIAMGDWCHRSSGRTQLLDPAFWRGHVPGLKVLGGHGCSRLKEGGASP